MAALYPTGRNYSYYAWDLMMFARNATAEITGTESDEYLTVSSDIIVRARLDRIDSEFVAKNSTFGRIRLEVLETIKGDSAERITVVLPGGCDNDVLKAWDKSGGERIAFLQCNGFTLGFQFHPMPGMLCPRGEEWLLPSRRRHRSNAVGYTHDFRAIRDYQSLCATVRQYASRAAIVSQAPPDVQRKLQFWTGEYWWFAATVPCGVIVDAPMSSDVWKDLARGSAVWFTILRGGGCSSQPRLTKPWDFSCISIILEMLSSSEQCSTMRSPAQVRMVDSRAGLSARDRSHMRRFAVGGMT